MQTALVTGASSGIGYEIAKIHASRGGHLVITARNEAKLNALKLELEAKYTISVHIIVKDLSLNNAALEIYNELKTIIYKSITLSIMQGMDCMVRFNQQIGNWKVK